jgi:Protein kinase domain/PEGA domain
MWENTAASSAVTPPRSEARVQRYRTHWGAIMSSRRIGTYQITDYIGSGGFGSVFKAEDVNTPGRVVAIKELHKKHTRNQVIKQRFFQEAVAMARLDHPNLPRLFTFGEDNGSYYLVMEFISGELLSDELHARGPMSSERAVAVLTQVLDALSYAHRNGIIHRDLKPDNIILVGNHGSLKIKVLDFGIARMVGGESLTLAGEGFGTPAYMAPERITGSGGDDPRMDMYSAGIVLFEMLSGKTPFESKASDPALYWAEMRDLHNSEPLPALVPLGVPAQLERMATRATAKRLEDRYQTADEMLADLKNLSGIGADRATIVLNGARLLLNTTPGAAEVYVDDVLRGASDATRGKLLIDGLTAGLHGVRVLKEGYNEYRINVSLEEGRQTDLQVALPARATVAIPPAENTAAGGFDTLKLQPADYTATALLVFESLPVGSTLFAGSEAVGRADQDGRATVKLAPGSHEIRATTPSGVSGTCVVSVTTEEIGASKTMTLPLPAASTAAQLRDAGSHPSRRAKQVAAAAVVILLLALAAAAYFVLRGPGRNRSTVETASVSPDGVSTPTAQASPSAKQPETQAGDPQAIEEKKKTAALEIGKKASEPKPEKSDKKDGEPQPPTVPAPPMIVPHPSADADALPEPEHRSTVPGREGCVLVTVTDPDGQPVQGVRVAVVEQPDSGSSAFFNGHTGERGRWQNCGLTPGHQIRVAVMGPRGGILGTQQTTVTAGRTFVNIRVQRKVGEAPPELGPKRRRLFPRQ